MQEKMTGPAIAREASRLLADPDARAAMREALADVARRLTAQGAAISRAADAVEELLEGQVAHVS